MKKEYILPVCFAVAAHGALLFGFPKSTRTAAAGTKDLILVTPVPVPPPEEPPMVEPAAESGPKAPPDVPQPPRSAEPIVLEVTDRPPMPLPPISNVHATDINVIPNLPPPGAGGGGDNPWGPVIASIQLDNAPRTRVQVAPIYPFEAKKNGVNGQVVVEFLVDERGNVFDPRIVSSTDRLFEEPTLRAVAKWKFEPGRRDGRIVRFRMAAPVVFNLND